MKNYSMWISPKGKKHYLQPYGHENWIADNVEDPEVKPLIRKEWRDKDEPEIAGLMYINMILPKAGWIRVEGGEPGSDSLTIDAPATEVSAIEDIIYGLPPVFKQIGIQLYTHAKKFLSFWADKQDIQDEGLARLMHRMRMTGMTESKHYLEHILNMLNDELNEWGFKQVGHGKIPDIEPHYKYEDDEEEEDKKKKKEKLKIGDDNEIE
jgi:hypothetical protein